MVFRSLAFQDVLKSHLSAFLSVFIFVEACCRGRIDGSVQQDRDEWKIFTASIDQQTVAMAAAMACCFFIIIIIILGLRQDRQRGWRGGGMEG